MEPSPALPEETRQRIETLIAGNDVTLFMKGNRLQPQCGFSATVVRILDALIPDYQTLDVLADPELREGIKVYSSWPTIPQLYVQGEFVGGCDIIQELFDSGELHETLGLDASPPAEPPTIAVTSAAAEGLRRAVEQQGAPGRELHLVIDARHQTQLHLAPRSPSDVEAAGNELTLLLDPMSARRADGATIDVVETPQGTGFRIDLPGAPRVRAMSVEELRDLIESGEPFEFMDVRTEHERELARIPGSTLMTDAEAERLFALPKDTKLVFICHTGGRSQQAAEHFTGQGFHDVHNVTGGLDAWSQEIDPELPRY